MKLGRLKHHIAGCECVLCLSQRRYRSNYYATGMERIPMRNVSSSTNFTAHMAHGRARDASSGGGSQNPHGVLELVTPDTTGIEVVELILESVITNPVCDCISRQKIVMEEKKLVIREQFYRCRHGREHWRRPHRFIYIIQASHHQNTMLGGVGPIASCPDYCKQRTNEVLRSCWFRSEITEIP